MQDSNIYIPVKFFFGKGRHKEVGSILKAEGAKKVMIHFGGGSVIRSGVLAEVEQSITDAGLEYIEFGGAQPNPVLSKVREGVALALKEQVNFILALGGGSVIDSAKAMVLGLEDPSIDVWDYFSLKRVPVPNPERHVKIGICLTIAGAGSEGNPNSVLTNDVDVPNRKADLWNEVMWPTFDIMNPEMLYTVPQFPMACAATDIVLHLLEGYFNRVAVRKDPTNEMTDRVTEAYIKQAMKADLAMMADRTNYAACSEVMYAGFSAHMWPCRVASIGDSSSHQMGHQLGATYEKLHGATVTAVQPWWARYVMHQDVERFIRLGVGCFDDIVDDGREDRESLAMETIHHFEEFFTKMGLPTSIGGLVGRTLSDEELHKIAYLAATTRNPLPEQEKCVGGLMHLYEDDLYKILCTANHM